MNAGFRIKIGGSKKIILNLIQSRADIGILLMFRNIRGVLHGRSICVIGTKRKVGE